MGHILPTEVPLRYDAMARVRCFTWVLDGTNAYGDWVEVPHLADVTIHAFGTWGAGTVKIEGSSEAVKPAEGTAANEYFHEDHQGTVIAFTANGGKGLDHLSRFIRPHATVGVTSVTVSMVFHKPQKG